MKKTNSNKDFNQYKEDKEKQKLINDILGIRKNKEKRLNLLQNQKPKKIVIKNREDYDNIRKVYSNPKDSYKRYGFYFTKDNVNRDEDGSKLIRLNYQHEVLKNLVKVGKILLIEYIYEVWIIILRMKILFFRLKILYYWS